MKDYSKLLEKAREAYKNCATGAEKRRLETIFPELKEVGDEYIKQRILEYFKDLNRQGYQTEEWISWIEKQGGQKPDWNEKDKKMLNRIIEEIRPIGECPDYPTNKERDYYYGLTDMVDWLESLKPNNWKPTEEQMQTLHAQLIEGAVMYSEDKRVLTTLYEDLSKL